MSDCKATSLKIHSNRFDNVLLQWRPGQSLYSTAKHSGGSVLSCCYIKVSFVGDLVRTVKILNTEITTRF